MKFSHFAAASAASVIALSSHAAAQTQIDWWHAMGGELGEKTEALATAFNATQSEFVVVPSYRGSYAETMTGAIAAFRAGEQPDIVQVFEVGTGTMMAAQGAIVPVYQLMANAGVDFDPSAFLPAVVGYYTDPEGNMLSMPFNSSTPILYYNRNIFEAAGLDPNTPPTTWAEVEEFSRQIVSSGAAECGFTSRWVSWAQLENFSAWHNQPIGTLQNGFGGLETELTFNGPVQVRHWENLARWEDEGLYRYAGPGGGNDAGPAFYSQTCGILMESSAGRAGVMANATDFEVGIGMLPYYDDVDGAPQNTIIGGATLWVLSGGSEEEQRGVAEFFNFLSSPEVQAQWHQDTGYLPITQAAYELSQAQGYYEANPGADTSIRQMTLNEPTENSRGLRFGNYVQIRTVIDEEFERLLSGAVDAQGALDAVVERGNALIREFEDANG
ncbi:sn-glycerol-3-phosphate ABC transporter substrate-binding protein UgpB [Roseicyclus marinus]|uniref:sn-glycerol-3-phosphate ABC transporter substrate-binding protein UgpB n=1 Tax=Roseicyclus marinus TaxID=2161673 RepID=UPI00240F4BB5|nr:sn-glycerol-3-phosphate ABC transporter substrate-binding protein UgpB [Roseicyclus marinus]MDG3042934.1 sn-glycerol-3-phosphate ABC transporter substrate-binding protein UgpB [Roseicyclus marinus]